MRRLQALAIVVTTLLAAGDDARAAAPATPAPGEPEVRRSQQQASAGETPAPQKPVPKTPAPKKRAPKKPASKKDAGPPSRQKPLNVVLIVGDDQGWGDFGFMGHPVIRTPHLDRLASQSLVYTRGYVPSSLCRPSLASIITGLYAHQHKITTNDPPDGLPRPEMLRQRNEQIAYIERAGTLPRLLGSRRYASLQTGKWWEGCFHRGGFTEGMTHGEPGRGGRHGDEGLKIGREGMKPVFDFLDQVGEQPFFLWYAPMLPHEPHNPPERLVDNYRSNTDSIHVARYWAMCEWFDETVGELLGYLDKKGLAQNTLVAFVVDNGWIQKPDAGGFAEKSKRSPYDGGLRTPILLRWPGRIAPRRDEENLAMSIDLAPTVLAACGQKLVPEMQGVNLLDRDAVANRKTVFGEVFAHSAVDIHRPAANLLYRWCIADHTKLILPNDPKPTGEPRATVELYDLKTDPHETKNLAAGAPAEVARLRQHLDAWWPAK